jgi:hypothetical protein
MAIESINPTSATVQHHTVTFTANMFDDIVITSGNLIGGVPLPDYAYVVFDGFANGTTSSTNRAGVYISIIGNWNNLNEATGAEFFIVQIKRIVDSTWINILLERTADSWMWPTSWRRFSVGGIVQTNPISDYHVRIGFYSPEIG